MKTESHTIKVTFSNGNVLTTGINGTKEEVENYYKIGRRFNLGNGEKDDMQTVNKVEFF